MKNPVSAIAKGEFSLRKLFLNLLSVEEKIYLHSFTAIAMYTYMGVTLG
jgi:hypothetical protein